jgi:hypothetical protein
MEGSFVVGKERRESDRLPTHAGDERGKRVA